MRRILLVCLASLLLLAPPALADQVTLTNGRVLEGKITEDGDHIIITTASGMQARIPRARVTRIEAGQTAAETVEARRKALDPADLEGRRKLARFCDARKLRSQARRIREQILERWPNDTETRKALGHVFHGGEWMTRADYMRSLGLVRSADGRTWISREEAARRAAAKEAKAQQKEVEKILRLAATKDPAELAARLAPFSDAAAVPVLIRKADSQSLPVRRLAIQELGRRKAQAAELALAKVAVEDPKSKARGDALNALGQLGQTTTARKYFLRSVARKKSPFKRTHAAEAVGRFPMAGNGAVPVLIRALRETTSNFGKANISVLTQRAYIQDFELSSGGTGNVVAEVADPVIGSFSEGTTLEMKVTLWERVTLLKVLRKLTGQDFGPKPDRWQRWWNQQRD
jgi:hypothetical protein